MMVKQSGMAGAVQSVMLRRMTAADALAWAHARTGGGVDPGTLEQAERIVQDVRTEGDAALRGYAERFGDCAVGAPLMLERPVLEAALAAMDAEDRGVLERVHDRISAFALAQRASMQDIDLPIPGGVARQRVFPLGVAGCYAPGGRYPLPSSVLMTAATARVAGVPRIIVASPRPAPVTLAAAALAGAECVLCAGGAHAVAAMAYGTASIPRADIVAGPGNRWVTAAKRAVSGQVRIDMLAGPSELLLIADRTADPQRVAADLLAQAEHDDDAVPMLIVTEAALLDAVDAEIAAQLEKLPTAETARAAIANGFAVVAIDIDEATMISDAIAPEHLQLSVADAESVREQFTRYGGLFAGEHAAEVLGDYGAGPNHTLPTGGSARSTGGLSVFDFLAIRTTLSITDARAASGIAADAAALARMEGLAGHRRAAQMRIVH